MPDEQSNDSVPISEYLLSIIRANDERYAQRFDAQEKAIQKAEAATDKRFDGMNEFRGQLAEQTRDLLTRREYEAQHGALVEQIEQVKARLSSVEGTKLGAQQTFAYVAAGFGTFIVVVSIIVAVVVHR